MARYLVTGGLGFLGAHLVRALVADGHRVVVLDNGSTGDIRRVSNLPVEVRLGDVRDGDLVLEAARGCQAVIHLAAVVGVGRAMRQRLATLETNILGARNVLEAAVRYGQAVFLASSSAVYGKSERAPLREEGDVLLGDVGRPCWTYSYAKLVEECLGRAYASEKGVRVTVGRLFNVIGPGDSLESGRVVPRFVYAALRGEPLVVYGSGEQTRSFTYCTDAVAGIRLVLERGESGQAYNIGSEEEVSIRNLAQLVLQVAGSRSPVRCVPYREVYGEGFEEPQRRVPDISRLRGLGYRPAVTLRQGLEAVVAWARRGVKGWPL